MFLQIDGLMIEAENVIVDDRRAMPKACDNCPFVFAAAGRDYLAAGRLDGIKLATFFGRPFHCHKTTGVTSGERSDKWHPKLRQCRGALDWLEALAIEKGLVVRRLSSHED